MPSAMAVSLMMVTSALLGLGLAMGRGLISPGRFARIVGGAGCGLVIVWAAHGLAGGGHG